MEGSEKDLNNLIRAVGDTKKFKEGTMLLPDEKIKSLEEENEKLKIAHEELIKQIEELSKNAFYDKLTGLKSRAFFVEEVGRILGGFFGKNLSEENRSSDENEENICMILFDIDKFKNVNDSLGHQAGDDVLTIVAQTIQDFVRDTDITARWGGEEMVVVLEGASIKEAIQKAEEIREKISEIKFEKYPNLKVTISAGVASASDFKDQKSFFKAADSAMYKSKESGRNMVTKWTEEIKKGEETI